MTKSQRVRYEMFLRVCVFWTIHLVRFPESSKGGQWFGKVAQAAARIEAQEPARLKAVDEGYHLASARVVLRRWMRDIVTASRDLARAGTPGVAPLQMPRRGNDPAVLAAANRILEAGASFSDELVQRGLGPDWATSFKAAIDAYAARLGGRRAGRYGAKAAQASVKAAIADGFEAVRNLDGIVAIAFRDDPVVMPAWQDCRRIVEGRRVGEATEGTPAEQPSPVPAPEPAPASVATTDDVIRKAS